MDLNNKSVGSANILHYRLEKKSIFSLPAWNFMFGFDLSIIIACDLLFSVSGFNEIAQIQNFL